MTNTVKLSDRHGPDAGKSSVNADPDLVAARLLLSHYIDKPPAGSVVINITPAIRDAMLERNVDNRDKKPTGIKKKAAYMAAGKWYLTGDTLKFGSDGQLLDGQNRLLAARKAGVPFKSHVVFGIDPGVFLYMDIGDPRNHSDALKVSGVKINNSNIAASIRWLIILSSDNPLDRSTINNDEIVNQYKGQYKDIGYSVSVGKRVQKVLRHPVGPVAACHYLFSKINNTKADEFFERWIDGRYSLRLCQIKALQNRLQGIKTQNHGRVHDGVRNALIIKSMNAYFNGAPMHEDECQWYKGEAFPRIGG